ncbi:MAG: Lrp/AsnC family transcriptional regulator [Candidatus Aenigmarchaeota archaeon]|nr:Lrp/AsnC family transcriptional regulator [Candidatus Aenigmarchaeota archaeon]
MGHDTELLRELSRDSRKSFREIARKLGIATTTVIKRYNKLVKDGVIKHTTIAVDHEKLGYSLSGVIELVVSKGKLIEVEEKIAKKHNVYGVYDITGDSDALVLARFRNREEMNDFVKSLLAMEYVERTNTHLILNVVKESMSAFW